jgi:hypothetical protein
MSKVNLLKIGTASAMLSLIAPAVANAANNGYGVTLGASTSSTSAPVTGIAPVSVLPYALLLVAGVIVLAILRKRAQVSR